MTARQEAVAKVLASLPEPAPRCPECDTLGLRWFLHLGKRTQVGDGRLSVHDVGINFVLGCEECSATVRVVDVNSAEGDRLMGLLNHAWRLDR